MQQLLTEVVNLKASDLHITVGLPPMMRLHGSLKPFEGWNRLTPADTEAMITGLMSPDVLKRFDEDGEVDFLIRDPGRGQVQGERLPPAHVGRGGVQGDTHRDQVP